MIKNLSVLFLIIVSANFSFAQADSFQAKAIRQQIAEEKLPILDTANLYLAKANNLLAKVADNEQEIISLKEEKQSAENKKTDRQIEKRINHLQKESKEMLFNVAEFYSQNYNMVYSVYRDRLVLYQSFDRYKRLRVRKLIEISKQNKIKIKIITDDISNVKDYNYLKQKVTKINLLRVEGIDKLNEAFCTFINCYKPIVNSTKKTVIKYNTETNYKQTKKYNVVFKVQILAVSRQIDIYYFKKKYNLTQVEEVYSEKLKLYRYFVGKFDDYYLAKDFSEEINIRDAFVVGYVDGKRTNIDQAIIKSEIRN